MQITIEQNDKEVALNAMLPPEDDQPKTHHAHANFKRKEKKYVLEAGDYLALMALIGDKLEEDEYPYSHIESLYYDTPDWRMINRSMEKPLYKEKLRVRVYSNIGEENAGEQHVAFVELKKKFKGIVYKRRVRMSAEGARAYTSGMPYEQAQRAYPIAGKDPEKELSAGNIQIARELDALFVRHPGLEPAMLISCMREAWCPLDPNDADCVDRVTFDEDICYVDLMQDAAVQR